MKMFHYQRVQQTSTLLRHCLWVQYAPTRQRLDGCATDPHMATLWSHYYGQGSYLALLIKCLTMIYKGKDISFQKTVPSFGPLLPQMKRRPGDWWDN